MGGVLLGFTALVTLFVLNTDLAALRRSLQPDFVLPPPSRPGAGCLDQVHPLLKLFVTHTPTLYQALEFTFDIRHKLAELHVESDPVAANTRALCEPPPFQRYAADMVPAEHSLTYNSSFGHSNSCR